MVAPPRKRRLNPTRRRALALLARAPHGASEERMLAHGFTRRMLTWLVRSGLALRYRMPLRVSGRTIEVTYVMITRMLGARSSPALPLAEPLAGGNLLADLVASIGRNDQTHHHPTVHGRGEFAARPSLYRGEDDVSEGAALHDRGDVIDEDGVGVAMILDRQSFDVSVFHRSPPSTANLRPRMEPALKLWAAKSRGAGLIPSLLAGSAAGDRCGIPGRTDGEPDYQSHCIQSDRRKSRTACWSVIFICRNCCPPTSTFYPYTYPTSSQ